LTVASKPLPTLPKTTKINYRSGKKLNKLENKGNKSREDAWVNEENILPPPLIWFCVSLSNSFHCALITLPVLLSTYLTGIDKSKGEDLVVTGTILAAAAIYTAIIGG
jgi:hypothetical protein